MDVLLLSFEVDVLCKDGVIVIYIGVDSCVVGIFVIVDFVKEII